MNLRQYRLHRLQLHTHLLLLSGLWLHRRRLRKLWLRREGCWHCLRELVGALSGDILQSTLAWIAIREVAGRIPFWVVSAPAVG